MFLKSQVHGGTERSAGRGVRPRAAIFRSHTAPKAGVGSDADPQALSECLEGAARLDLDRALPLTDGGDGVLCAAAILEPRRCLSSNCSAWGPDDRVESCCRSFVWVAGALNDSEEGRPRARRSKVEDCCLTRFQSLAKHAPTANQESPVAAPNDSDTIQEGPADVVSAPSGSIRPLRKSPPRRTGSVPVKMELLAPNQRPVQVTQDLASFWSNTYAEVRKELRQRYPKHQWPEDPGGRNCVSTYAA